MTSATRGAAAPAAHRHAWQRSERGSAAELAVVTVPLVLILLLIVAMGRVSSARAEVDAAARDAARAASIARSPGAATNAAEAAAAASLSDNDLACRSFVVTVELTNFRPGGNVVAEVACTISLSELGLLQLGSSSTITSRFTEPVDTFLGMS